MITPGALRPSSAPRWSRCALSWSLERAYPGSDGEAARQGTAAHWYVTEAVQGRVNVVGAIAPNGVPIDAEMIECGQQFIDHAATLGTPQMVEHRLTMHATIHPDCGGTPDMFVLDRNAHTLHVVDYKYGHRYSHPGEQWFCYAAGAIEAAGLGWDDVKGWEIFLTVVQPRNYDPAGTVRTVRMLGHELRREVDKLAAAALRAKSPDADATTGDHCRDCSGRHACETLRRVGAYVLDLSGESVPHEIPDAALGLTLTHIARAQARLEALRTGLEAQAMGRIRANAAVPGWSLLQGLGREKWTLPDAAIVAIGENMGADFSKISTITPNQARKLVDPTLIDAFATRPHGEFKLSPADPSAFAKAFSK